MGDLTTNILNRNINNLLHDMLNPESYDIGPTYNRISFDINEECFFNIFEKKSDGELTKRFTITIIDNKNLK